MASLRSARRLCFVTCLAIPFLSACPGDDGGGENVLPTADGTASSAADDDGGDGATSTDPGMTSTDGGGGEVTFPRTYRFDCIDIRVLGDSDGDGVGDGEAFQAGILGDTWTGDIDAYRLNIMLTVTERDVEGGSATIDIGSGIGAGDDDQCVEPTSSVPGKAAGFDPATQMWGPGTGGLCSSASPAEGAGTYSLELGADEVIYVYAADDAGTALNCVPGDTAPHAVPVRALRATVTAAPGEDVAYGELSGCLTRTEAAGLCSCLGGACAGEPNENCPGCTPGSVPLETLLGSIGATDNCTAVMGEEAFDLTVGFSVSLLPNVPAVCG